MRYDPLAHGITVNKPPQCPYCGESSQPVTGKVIYPHRPDLEHLNFYLCAPCEAYVGCHDERYTLDKLNPVPLGRLANAELRKAKQLAHSAFDQLWKTNGMTRAEAYTWLASEMGIDKDKCHIGMFDVEQCYRAFVISMEKVVEVKE